MIALDGQSALSPFRLDRLNTRLDALHRGVRVQACWFVYFIVAVAAPFLPGARLIGLVPLPLAVVVSLAAVTTAYAAAVEFFKIRFYRRLARSR